MTGRILILGDGDGGPEALRDGPARGLLGHLRSRGFNPRVAGFADIRRPSDHAGVAVLYLPAGTVGPWSRSYVEDVILALELAGARPVPPYRFLRAQANRVFLDLMEPLAGPLAAQVLPGRAFGTLADLARSDYREWAYPKLLRRVDDSAADGQRLIRSADDLLGAAARLSFRGSAGAALRRLATRTLRPDNLPEGTYNRKLLVEDVLPGLDHDYRVLVFADRYYPLRRGLRPGASRADGSDWVEYPSVPPVAVLDLARKLRRALGVPMAAFDIAPAAAGPLLTEAEFVGFDTRALDGAQGFFRREGDSWRWHARPPDLGEAIAHSVACHFALPEGGDD